jgi:hypothetical protein
MLNVFGEGPAHELLIREILGSSPAPIRGQAPRMDLQMRWCSRRFLRGIATPQTLFHRLRYEAQ